GTVGADAHTCSEWLPTGVDVQTHTYGWDVCSVFAACVGHGRADHVQMCGVVDHESDGTCGGRAGKVAEGGSVRRGVGDEDVVAHGSVIALRCFRGAAARRCGQPQGLGQGEGHDALIEIGRAHV